MRWLWIMGLGLMSLVGRADEAATNRVMAIESRGLMVDPAEWSATGRVVVVLYHASWDIPSREVIAGLASLDVDHREVKLVTVDVVDPRTQVARQNQVRTLPDIRIYDRDGEWVPPSVHGLEALRERLASMALMLEEKPGFDGQPKDE